MQDLKFRVFKKDDIKAVVELINKAYRENNPNSWTSEAHLLSGIRVNEDMLNEILKNKNIVTYIALLDEKIVATIQTKLEAEDIHIGLFAVHPDFQSFGVGKKILAFAEESAKKLWKKSSFVMEVISNRVELKEYYNRRGYKDTETFIEFPKSKHWLPLVDEELSAILGIKQSGATINLGNPIRGGANLHIDISSLLSRQIKLTILYVLYDDELQARDVHF